MLFLSLSTAQKKHVAIHNTEQTNKKEKKKQIKSRYNLITELHMRNILLNYSYPLTNDKESANCRLKFSICKKDIFNYLVKLMSHSALHLWSKIYRAGEDLTTQTRLFMLVLF